MLIPFPSHIEQCRQCTDLIIISHLTKKGSGSGSGSALADKRYAEVQQCIKEMTPKFTNELVVNKQLKNGNATEEFSAQNSLISRQED